MRIDILIYPLLAMILLTFGVGVALAFLRVRAGLSGEVSMKDVALDDRGWPERVRQVGNSFGNQFEMPTLFYLLCVLLMMGATLSPWFVWLAWGYVGLRYLHAFIHVTTNVVVHRFYAYFASNSVLAVMWLLFALERLPAQ